MTTAMIWLSALPLASDEGSSVVIASVCRYRRPLAAPPLRGCSGMPLRMLAGSIAAAADTSSSRKREVCRALRATSVMPFLLLSSSSSVKIGRKMACSSNRNRLGGSCIRTLVSSTKSLVTTGAGESDDLESCGVERVLRSTMGLLGWGELPDHEPGPISDYKHRRRPLGGRVDGRVSPGGC